MSEFNRLPDNVVPILYDLKLLVDLNSKSFDGILSIEIDVVSLTKSIILNSHELIVAKAIVNNNIKAEITYVEDSQKIILNFEEYLPLSNSILYLNYSGTLSSTMKGFYHSSYIATDDKIENLAVTHFEPTNARYAFPCWDEPSFRSQFKISIGCAKGLTVISNMPVKNVNTDNDTMVVHQFETTPPMSTYLVAFAIGNLEQKQLPGTNISVYCRRDTPDNWASFALDVAFRSIEFYNEWFGIKYNLPKLDLLAVPDFAGGAMENWGLVTFRERALLVSEEETSIATKQRVALIISHELAHMWFGNLVTLEWWTDLWLKEGFAKWIEYFCVDHCFPNYEIWNQFSVNEYLRTMKLDSMLSTHPIEVCVKSPAEISEIFDTISYAKGASVIRMLFYYLGEKEFQIGLQQYLHSYKFKATKTEDLWNSLQKCTDKPVKEVMNSWTQQSGYPIVSVDMKFSESGEIDSLQFTQERFFQSGESHSDMSLWNIPITIANSENPREEILSFVMRNKDHVIDLTKLNRKYSCVFINPSAIGIYRVHYRNKGILNILKKCLSLSSWSANDKFSFLEDCFALSNAGKIPYGEILDMLDFMKHERSYTIWEMVDSNLEDIHNLLDESIYGVKHIDKFIKQLAMDSYERLGWKDNSNDNYNDILLRPLIINLLSLVNETEVIHKAKDIFMNFINNGETISANIRRIIYLIVGMHASNKEYDLLSDRFVKCKTGNEQSDIINGLGMVPIIMQDKFIAWILSPEVRKQDKLIGFIAASNRSSKHREHIWLVIQNHWDTLRDMYSGQFLMGSLLKGCLNGFCNLDKAEDIKKFFQENDSTSPRNVSQVLEKIESNSKRLNMHMDHVHEYLTGKQF